MRILSSVALALLLFSGCLKDNLTKRYTIMYPVYEQKSTVLANIRSSTPVDIKQPGKIFMYGKYIFLNEINKGVHIIDNENPSAPQRVAFINIPGNLDIAVKGTNLYADLYTDMITIDISNPLAVKMGKLVPKIFPELEYTNGFNPDTTKIIVDWIVKDTVVTVPRSNLIDRIRTNCPNCAFAADNMSSGGKAASVPGMGGSMARFAIVNDYMYAVNRSALETISLTDPTDPKRIETGQIGWNIETIYPFKDKLFIGSTQGMFIYEIDNPAKPVRAGSVSHMRACDPVVADDNFAFVTLRAGTFCEGVNNQLDVVNVSNVYAPTIVKSYGMTNPFGLAKDGNTLFICDGRDGLKVYDASRPTDLKLLQHLKGMETYDVIAYNKRLLLVTSDGLKQYDYSNISNIRLLSSINVTD
ncbi:MAG: hypothetical protein H7Y31_16975 [Chitinophagaceae bacterium]|nr:hypothetical protein [Chitinophagaceae bacterium]